MIIDELFEGYLIGKTPSQLRKITEQRLLGNDKTLIFFEIPDQYESPEDLIIELLGKADLSPAMRREIINGCEEVYHKLFSWLISDICLVSGESPEKEAIFRLCRVVKDVAPSELEGFSHAAFSSILDKPEIHGKIRQVITEAFAVYANTRDLRSWVEALNTPETAKCAFEVLLKILSATKINFLKKELRDLWYKQFVKGWEMDVRDLARQIEKKYGPEAVKEVLADLYVKSLADSNSNWWETLQTNLGQKVYSRKWLNATDPNEI